MDTFLGGIHFLLLVGEVAWIGWAFIPAFNSRRRADIRAQEVQREIAAVLRIGTCDRCGHLERTLWNGRSL